MNQFLGKETRNAPQRDALGGRHIKVTNCAVCQTVKRSSDRAQNRKGKKRANFSTMQTQKTIVSLSTNHDSTAKHRNRIIQPKSNMFKAGPFHHFFFFFFIIHIQLALARSDAASPFRSHSNSCAMIARNF